MSGIIPLVSDFSVNLVLTRGRVSLTHLLEFSNFVDLYVLEDDIFVEEAAIDVNFQSLAADPTFPFSPIKREELWWPVSQIRDYTFGIYNAAPKERSFSLGSYEYWLSLNLDEKGKIPEHWHSGIEMFKRSGLLYSSKALDTWIHQTLEQLATTQYTLLPSPSNLLPFLSVFHQVDTPAMLAYREIAAEYRVNVEKVLSLVRPRCVYLPPLLAILLSRCQKRDDLSRRLIEMRAEYQQFRLSLHSWFQRLDSTDILSDKLEIRSELDRAIGAIVKHSSERRRGFYKQLAGAAIEGASEGDLKKMILKPAVIAAKEAINSVIPESLSFRRFTGLVDLLDQALNIENYSGLLQRVFAEDLDITQTEISSIRQYQKKIMSSYNFAPPIVS